MAFPLTELRAAQFSPLKTLNILCNIYQEPKAYFFSYKAKAKTPQ